MMNLFRPDKMIVLKWILYSSFFVICGSQIYPTFEERIERLMGLSILFAIASGVIIIAESGLSNVR